MVIVSRVLGLAAAVALAGVGLAYALLGGARDALLLAIVLGCVGAIVGSLAGLAREIVAAQGRKPLV